MILKELLTMAEKNAYDEAMREAKEIENERKE